MRVLIVDDEEGIREGLASFLRHHGHTVATAESCAGALAALRSQAFDVLVTDWRLTDGTAKALLGTELPTIVITGLAEEVPESVAVLRKPVLPAELLRELAQRMLVLPTPKPHPAQTGAPFDVPELHRLPPDSQDRIRLLLQAAGVSATIHDDGEFVTTTVDLTGLPVPGTMLDSLGGDWWMGDEAGRTMGRWRCHRDGRPAGVHTVIAPRQPWPQDPLPFAIDLHEQTLSPDSFLTLLDVVTRARHHGREIHLLNVPSHLRLYAELLGRAADLPMRASGGPRLAAAQRQLWS